MKKNVLLTLTALMILLIIGSVILFFQNQNLKNEIAILNNKIADLEKQKSATITPAPVAKEPPKGWTEYKNEKCKFKIFYPSRVDIGSSDDLRIAIFEEPTNDGYLILFSNELEFLDELIPPNFFRIDMINKEITNIKEFIKEDVKNGFINIEVNTDQIDQYISQTKLNNLDVIKLEIPEGDLKYYIAKNNLTYVLWFPGSTYIEEEIKNFRAIFEQMVQSFQFID